MTNVPNKQNAGKYERELRLVDKVIKKLHQLQKTLKECNHTEWSYDTGGVMVTVKELKIQLDELK